MLMPRCFWRYIYVICVRAWQMRMPERVQEAVDFLTPSPGFDRTRPDFAPLLVLCLDTSTLTLFCCLHARLCALITNIQSCPHCEIV